MVGQGVMGREKGGVSDSKAKDSFLSRINKMGLSPGAISGSSS